MDCTAHPGEPITGTCARCGNFFCRLDSRAVDGATYCAECAAREVDWLEAFRLELWGKRDGFAYFYGVLGTLGHVMLLLVIGGAAAVAPNTAMFVLLGICVVSLVIDVAYFFGVEFARVGILLVPVANLAFQLAFGPGAAEQAPNLIQSVVAFAIAASAYQSPRSKLFFRVDVTRNELMKVWNLYRNNTLARTGFFLSFLGFVPFVSILSGTLCAIGLARVNPDSKPPIGRKGQAIAGLVLSALGIVWTVFIVVMSAFA